MILNPLFGGHNVHNMPKPRLRHSNYLAAYDACRPPRRSLGKWQLPIYSVRRSLPLCFKQSEWDAAVETILATKGGMESWPSPLQLAGATCARLWTKSPLCRLVQQV